MSGLLSVKQNRLTIKNNKINLVKKILEEEPKFRANIDPIEYLRDFYQGIPLPTDKKSVALTEIKNLQASLSDYGKKPSIDSSELARKSPQELERYRLKLEELLLNAQEESFAKEHAEKSDDVLKEVEMYLQYVLEDKDPEELEFYDRPAFLEWVIWRYFLILNSIKIPVKETRGFPIDEDLLPRHTAPGGVPDMMFEFEDYILVTEVTLTTSQTQINREAEPVRRHVANFVNDEDKQVYGLFLAPTIEPNVANEFKEGQWFDNNNNKNFVDIVPLTLEQFKSLKRVLRRNDYRPDTLRNLLVYCLAERNKGLQEWLEKIDSHIDQHVATWS